jgi:UDP-N-acetylmuramyl tripeptide synthase
VLKIEYFAYVGPNWRSDKTVVEIRMDFNGPDGDGFPPRASDARKILITNGILAEHETFPAQSLPGDRQAWCASLLAQTALLFQRKSGHRVDFFAVLPGTRPNHLVTVLEYEQADVGLTSVKLAWEFLSGQRKLLAEPFRQFSVFAQQRLLPADTAALISAARNRGIPMFHMERAPFSRERFAELTGGECIRRNGMVMLGNGAHQRVLDGTFCIDRFQSLRGLLNSRSERRAFLAGLSWLTSAADVNEHQGQANCELVMINGAIFAALDRSSGLLIDRELPEDLPAQAISLHKALDQAPLAIAVRIEPAEKAAPGTGFHAGFQIIDFDLAPRLDAIFARTGSCRVLLERAAGSLLDGWFPPGAPVGLPIFAITGTNGKTTTTRMLERILSMAGNKTGMVCTDGLFINGVKDREGDMGTILGHAAVLSDRSVDVAVLETHHRGILRRGFAYQHCNVGICLNVSDDHLGAEGIDTVEQMALVKRAVPERAREIAVLNADDPNCFAMRQAMSAKTLCLVSVLSGIEELRKVNGAPVNAYCVIEQLEGQDWIVVYQGDLRSPVMAVNDIPATFQGTARFNVSNAMHAIAATLLFGVEEQAIVEAMSGFTAGQENTPGRMNVFDDLPFRIIMDFAHNPDGMRNICEFVDAQTVSGRKILAFSGDTSRQDETIKKVGRMVAGYFDFYFCKDYVPAEGRPKRVVTHLLKEGLLENGVEEHNIAVTTSGKSVLFDIFDYCRPGDLLVILMGHVEKQQLPGYIFDYAERLKTGNMP